MCIKIFTLAFFLCGASSQNRPPAEFWNQYDKDQKIAFINGAYGAISKIKSHHKLEVKKQYLNYKNWVQPYYIERFYEISDEYISEKVGYDLSLIASHMDAFYSNSDNFNIPVMDALRVVSLVQDNENKKANLRLLRYQQKYRK
tara:strand:+ start:48 stop:479 length:432 start_codon:yes stop_codon:yes gene_type:complete